MITRLEKNIEKRIAQPVINFSKIMKSLLIESDYIYRPKFLLNKNSLNLTLGLNYRRLSPAHGTAIDIKNKLLANNRSYLKCLLF